MKLSSIIEIVVVVVAMVLCPASALGANIVENGDFEWGNGGFSSNYMSPPYTDGTIWAEGTYAITTNPILVHGLAASFGDHTTGTGYMLAASSPEVVRSPCPGRAGMTPTSSQVHSQTTQRVLSSRMPPLRSSFARSVHASDQVVHDWLFPVQED